MAAWGGGPTVSLGDLDPVEKMDARGLNEWISGRSERAVRHFSAAYYASSREVSAPLRLAAAASAEQRPAVSGRLWARTLGKLDGSELPLWIAGWVHLQTMRVAIKAGDAARARKVQQALLALDDGWRLDSRLAAEYATLMTAPLLKAELAEIDGQ